MTGNENETQRLLELERKMIEYEKIFRTTGVCVYRKECKKKMWGRK